MASSCTVSNSSLLSQLGHQSNIQNIAVKQLLWKHADPNATDVNGSTPLCAASELGRLEVVRCLCDVGAE